jgi:uncharacterized protein YfkK (UPF0435 family)
LNLTDSEFHGMIFLSSAEGMNEVADLSVKSTENIKIMINGIQEKLQMINSSAMRADSFNDSSYEDLLEIYEMVMSKDRFSPSEMQAIVEEIGKLRK